MLNIDSRVQAETSPQGAPQMCGEFLFGCFFLKESEMLQWYWVYVLPCQWPFCAESAKRSNDVCKRWCNISWHCALMSSKTLHGSPSNLTGSAGFIFCPQLNHGVLPDKMQVLCLQFLTCMDDVAKISQDWYATIWYDLMQCRLLPVGLPYLIGHWYIVHDIFISILYIYIILIYIILYLYLLLGFAAINIGSYTFWDVWF